MIIEITTFHEAVVTNRSNGSKLVVSGIDPHEIVPQIEAKYALPDFPVKAIIEYLENQGYVIK